MGLRFNKRIKVGSGMTLNLNKKSVGVSVGGKGMKYTVNSKGKRTSTVGLPGTGLYYSKSSGSKQNKTSGVQKEYHSTQSEYMKPTQMKMGLIPLLLTIFLGWSGIQWFMVGRIGKGLLYLFTVGLCCVGWFIDIINQTIGFVKLVSQVAKEQKEGQVLFLSFTLRTVYAFCTH